MVAHRIKPLGEDTTVIYLDESYKRDAFVQLVGETSAVVAKGRANVILNMAALPAITSEGIGLLVLANDKCQEASGKLLLCEVPQRVEHVIKLAGLTRFFETAASEEEALDKLEGGKPAEEPEPAKVEEDKPAEEEELTEEERVRKIIASTVKSRAHQRLIESFTARSFKTSGLDDIAASISYDREKALAVCTDLVNSRIMTTDDNEIFTFAPDEGAEEQLRTFRKAWSTPRFRTRIMAWLYSEEKKPQ